MDKSKIDDVQKCRELVDSHLIKLAHPNLEEYEKAILSIIQDYERLKKEMEKHNSSYIPREQSDFKYIVWQNNGYDGWSWAGYDTLEEALKHESYGSEKAITRPVSFKIEELDLND